MKNNLTPNYLSDLVPSNVGRDHRYPLRNTDHIQTLPTHSITSFYYNSCLPSVNREFNSLHVIDASSLASFKRLSNKTRCRSVIKPCNKNDITLYI